MSALLDTPTTTSPTGPPQDAPETVPGPPPTGGRLARLAAALAVLAALAAVVASLVAGDGTDRLPRGAVSVLAGGAVEVADGEGWRSLEVGDGIVDGARLRAVDDTATLDLDDGQLRLAAGSHVRVGTTATVLERGTVLVDAAEHTVTVGAVEVAGSGTWRVDDGTQPRVGSYDATVAVRDGGAEREVGALEQLSVRDGAATDVVPLRYLASDPFDAELLRPAFEVDELAASLGRSLASAHGTGPRDLDFYGSFVTVGPAVGARLRDAAPEVDGEAFGPPADVLLTVVTIDAIGDASERGLAGVADQVVAERRRGASWGLIVHGAGLGGSEVRAAADRALERAEADPPPSAPEPSGPADEAPPAPEPAPPTPAPSPPTGGGGSSAPSGGSAGEGSSGGSGGGGSGGGGSGDGTGGGGSGDDGGALRPVEDLLRGTGDAVGGLVEGTTDTLGDVVGGVDELLSPGGLLGGG